MRYDYKPHNLEKGDEVLVKGVDVDTVFVKKPANINEFEQVYIIVDSSDDTTDLINKSYVKFDDSIKFSNIK